MNKPFEQMPSPEKNEISSQERLAKISGMLLERVKAHDFQIVDLPYQQALDTLEKALINGEDWAYDRLSTFEKAVREYVSGNRMSTKALTEQIDGTLADYRKRNIKYPGR